MRTVLSLEISLCCVAALIFIQFQALECAADRAESNDGDDETATRGTLPSFSTALPLPATLKPDTTPTPIPTTTLSPDDLCQSFNGSCENCISSKNASCYYCTKNNKCLSLNPDDVTHLIPKQTCGSLDDVKTITCLVSLKVIYIVAGVIGGVVFVAISCCCFCFCRKSKNRRAIKELTKWEKTRETRKAATEERRKERQERMDQIRSKYGLSTDDSKYSRF